MKALIADDEPLLALSLKTALGEAWPELEIAAVVPNGLEAVQAAERLRPDVAFLDIRMPGMDGLEAAAEIADRMGEAAPAIVFVTAYDEYATRAFELAAADYVLKPVAADRLGSTVARLRSKQRGLQELARQLRTLGTLVPPRTGILQQVRAGSGHAVKLIPLDEVCYFQSADKYTTVVTAEGEELIRTPLKELGPQLPEGFQQVHRGTIVNLRHVAAAVRDETGRVTLRLRDRKETLAVSRVYADLFRAM
jgi:DNA-binding LytR/AlgR family response regulator